MEKTPNWAIAVGVCVLLVVFTTITLVAAGGWQWFAGFLESKAADWFQAISAPVAIFAAYFIGNAQIRAQRRLERERDIKTLRAIDALLVRALAACVTYLEFWNKVNQTRPIGPDFRIEFFQQARNALERIDPMQCPSAEVIVALVQMPAVLDEVMEAHTRYESAHHQQAAGRDMPSQAIKLSLSECTQNLHDALVDASRQLVATQALVERAKLQLLSTV